MTPWSARSLSCCPHRPARLLLRLLFGDDGGICCCCRCRLSRWLSRTTTTSSVIAAADYCILTAATMLWLAYLACWSVGVDGESSWLRILPLGSSWNARWVGVAGPSRRQAASCSSRVLLPGRARVWVGVCVCVCVRVRIDDAAGTLHKVSPLDSLHLCNGNFPWSGSTSLLAFSALLRCSDNGTTPVILIHHWQDNNDDHLPADTGRNQLTHSAGRFLIHSFRVRL